jgi:hypothetical protein
LTDPTAISALAASWDGVAAAWHTAEAADAQVFATWIGAAANVFVVIVFGGFTVRESWLANRRQIDTALLAIDQAMGMLKYPGESAHEQRPTEILNLWMVEWTYSSAKELVDGSLARGAGHTKLGAVAMDISVLAALGLRTAKAITSQHGTNITIGMFLGEWQTIEVALRKLDLDQRRDLAEIRIKSRANN